MYNFVSRSSELVPPFLEVFEVTVFVIFSWHIFIYNILESGNLMSRAIAFVAIFLIFHAHFLRTHHAGLHSTCSDSKTSSLCACASTLKVSRPLSSTGSISIQHIFCYLDGALSQSSLLILPLFTSFVLQQVTSGLLLQVARLP